jgi:diguanylate cyclase (GGDEF)-like protein
VSICCRQRKRLHIGDSHDVYFDGMKPHGHYCVPIIYQEKLQGVINLYVADGHKYIREEEEFLATIANTLAGLIERKRMEEKVEKLASTDSLTNLPNRSSFLERLSQEITRARREKTFLSILFMDLDHFKKINDCHGHPVGDELLVQASIRIKSCLREHDMVARFGGDEFCILLPAHSNRNDAQLVARKIVEMLDQMFHISGNQCQIGSSIGVAHFPENGETPEELVRRADLALYSVKMCGRNNYLLYDPDMEDILEHRSLSG